MSQNYVLAEYKGQTRKIVIPGDWNKKSFNFLIKELKAKFLINEQIEINVFDKKNNQYFQIDKSEMREIKKAGKIKVSLSKSNKGKGGGNKSSKGNTNKGPAPMIPPGAPAYSKQDDQKRKAWKLGSKVEIYSEGQRKWQKGEIAKIYTDNEGEWLVISYAGYRTKEIQRFSNYIRPTLKPPANKKKDTKNNKAETKGKETKGMDKKDKPLKNKKKKEPKKRKPSTKDKYMKKKKAPEKKQFAENEVYITGNTKHVKKYIDRAYLLLVGTADTPKTEQLVPSAQSDDDDEEQEAAAASNEEDEEEEEEEVMINPADLKKVPSKIYDVVHLYGNSRAMGAVVTTAEIVKRIVGDLYQVTSLEPFEIIDVWTPTEQGLKEVEVIKTVTRLKITLCKKSAAQSLDADNVGYQEPSEQPFVTVDYSPNDKRGTRGTRGRGRGRGKGTKGGRGGGQTGKNNKNGGKGRGKGN